MMDQTNLAPSPLGTLLRGLSVQGNVIGALIMRELHTRYGRDNIGYLWMILEPMTLAAAVGSLHILQKGTSYSSDIQPVPFAVCGYCCYIVLRTVVGRSEGVIESNAPLLYHRMVSLFDMVFSRTLLEAAGIGVTLVILLALASVMGLGHPPARPLALMTGFALITWFTFGLSAMICAGTNDNRTAGRLVHPALYIFMPLSGAFYRVQWIPHAYRDLVTKIPTVQIFELVRYGQFRTATDIYFDPIYVVGWCAVLTFIGLVWLKVARRYIHLH